MMNILVDHEIAELCKDTVTDSAIKGLKTIRHDGMIYPFYPESIKLNEEGQKIPSYGLSSCGYDIRLAPEFKLFTKPNDGRVIDVMDFKEDDIVNEVKGNSVIIPPGGLLLGRTVETFNMPKNVIGIAVGKSTWARLGASVLVTPLEPGWRGELVVEIVNGTNLPLKIYAGVGIAQIMFVRTATPSVSYADRAGKYQDQTGVTSSKL